MPNSFDILKEKTLSNGQAIGLIVAMFAGFEFYYSGTNTTETFTKFLSDEREHRELMREEHAELKGLSYRLTREAKDEVNARMDRKVNPLQKKVEEINDWIQFQKGYQKGLHESTE